MSSAISHLMECPLCRGKGYRIVTRLEQDTAQSLLLGAATGTGYFPVLKMHTEQQLCEKCMGRRVVEKVN